MNGVTTCIVVEQRLGREDGRSIRALKASALPTLFRNTPSRLEYAASPQRDSAMPDRVLREHGAGPELLSAPAGTTRYSFGLEGVADHPFEDCSSPAARSCERCFGPLAGTAADVQTGLPYTRTP